MRQTALAALAGFALLGMTACTTVASTDKTLIQDQAAVGVGILSDWDAKNPDGTPKMTDDQKKQAYWKSTRGYHRLNNTLFSIPVPDDFQKDPWASKTVRSAPTVHNPSVEGGK